jgi:plastocyanin
MLRFWFPVALALMAGCELSCSNKAKVTDQEEYPDFSQPKVPEGKDDTISLCVSQPQRPNYHVVVIRGMEFQPPELLLHKGDTVVWINCDITNHDVTEETRHAWHSSPLATTQSWMKVVSESADYFCSIHVVMKGKLRVE